MRKKNNATKISYVFYFLGEWYNKNVTHFFCLSNNSWCIDKFILFSKKKKKKRDEIGFMVVDAHFCKFVSKSPYGGKPNEKQGLKAHQEV